MTSRVADARVSAPERATTATAPEQLLLSLQRAAGNRAVTRYLQRDDDPADAGATAGAGAAPVPQEEDAETPPDRPASRLAELDEMLDRFNTPEDEVIDLLGAMGPGDQLTVIDSYRDRLVDCLNGGEMLRAVTNLHPPLRTALDWIDAAALFTSAIDYSEIQGLVTRADSDEREAVGTNHYRDIFVKVCDNSTMITALVDLNFPWEKARQWAREEGTGTLDLARGLARSGRITVSDMEEFLNAVGEGASVAREHLRSLDDDTLTDLRAEPAAGDVIRDELGTAGAPVLSALAGEISSGEATITNSEDLLAGDTTGPFTLMHFGGDQRFNVTYRRDGVDVAVGVALTAADDRAGLLLPAAKNIWLGRIQAAWGSRFQLTNGQRTIPLRFQVSLDAGPNQVNAHSGHWAWPKLNAGNWFVPDHEQVPEQEEAVSQAPVHEFGHLIGNVDEYSRTAEHYVQVTQQPLTSHGTVAETDTAGVTRYTNALSLMGSGTTIEPRHCDAILRWVNQNLRVNEPAFSVVA
jgi:hypothetical protein